MREICKLALDGMKKTDSNSPTIFQKITFNLFHAIWQQDGIRLEGFYRKQVILEWEARLFICTALVKRQFSKSSILSSPISLVGWRGRSLSKWMRVEKVWIKGRNWWAMRCTRSFVKLLFEGEGDDYSFDHVLLALEWNLLVQSDNYLAMNVNHVQWENDILVFYFEKTKGEQSGDKSGDTWHIYSNPNNPELYPILVLAKYLLSYPNLLNGNFSFPQKQPIRPLHKNISQGHTWQQGNFSYSWCGGSLVRVPFMLEGINKYVLV